MLKLLKSERYHPCPPLGGIISSLRQLLASIIPARPHADETNLRSHSMEYVELDALTMIHNGRYIWMRYLGSEMPRMWWCSVAANLTLLCSPERTALLLTRGMRRYKSAI